MLIENFRPGVMDRLGLGAEALLALNPRLIYCAISGFGLTGPLRDKPSFDIVTQALTGVLSVNGEQGRPPVKLGLPVGDMSGGVFGAIAILSALHERTTTGCGRLIDVSLYDGTMSLLGYLSQLAFLSGEDWRGRERGRAIRIGDAESRREHCRLRAGDDGDGAQAE